RSAGFVAQSPDLARTRDRSIACRRQKQQGSGGRARYQREKSPKTSSEYHAKTRVTIGEGSGEGSGGESDHPRLILSSRQQEFGTPRICKRCRSFPCASSSALQVPFSPVDLKGRENAAGDDCRRSCCNPTRRSGDSAFFSRMGTLWRSGQRPGSRSPCGIAKT